MGVSPEVTHLSSGLLNEQESVAEIVEEGDQVSVIHLLYRRTGGAEVGIK